MRHKGIMGIILGNLSHGLLSCRLRYASGDAAEG